MQTPPITDHDATMMCKKVMSASNTMRSLLREKNSPTQCSPFGTRSGSRTDTANGYGNQKGVAQAIRDDEQVSGGWEHLGDPAAQTEILGIRRSSDGPLLKWSTHTSVAFPRVVKRSACTGAHLDQRDAAFHTVRSTWMTFLRQTL